MLWAGKWQRDGNRASGTELMKEAIEGVDATRKNLKLFQRQILARLLKAMEFVAMAIVVHIQITYQRPLSGKGFTDRTGALRQSITYKVRIERNMIVVYIYAGMEYAPHVEYVVAGKYAFMLPGFLDMKREIIPLILREMKRHGLIINRGAIA